MPIEERIDIAVAADQNYFLGLFATVGSIARYANRDVSLHFHVLDGGIGDESFDRLTKMLNHQHPHVDVSRIAVDESRFGHFPTWGGSRMAYARILLPELLPDVEHVIYSDVDVLWLADISELWQQRSKDVILHGVLDCVDTRKKEAKWFAERKLPLREDHYICSGLCLFNLEKFREERIPQRFGQFIVDHPDILFVDQTVLNALLGDRIKLLDGKWMKLSLCLTRDDFNSPLVIHYADDAPWRCDFWANLISDAHMIWHRLVESLSDQACGIERTCLIPLRRYIYKRGLVHCLRNNLFSFLFFGMLRASGRGSYRALMERQLRNLDLRQIYKTFSLACRSHS